MLSCRSKLVDKCYSFALSAIYSLAPALLSITVRAAHFTQPSLSINSGRLSPQGTLGGDLGMEGNSKSRCIIPISSSGSISYIPSSCHNDCASSSQLLTDRSALVPPRTSSSNSLKLGQLTSSLCFFSPKKGSGLLQLK